MTLTCGVCGHRGEDGTTYRHDCYWVFRERGEAAHRQRIEARSPAVGRRMLLDEQPVDLAAGEPDPSTGLLSRLDRGRHDQEGQTQE